MDKHHKLFEHIMMRKGDAHVPFLDLCELLVRMGFDMRTKGDHHMFTMVGVEEILNLQPKHGKAKPYQVKQVRNIFHMYGLEIGE
jgi:hypothetical protein